MIKFLTTIAAVLLPIAAYADGSNVGGASRAVASKPTPDLIFRLGAGLSYGPTYFGSKESGTGAFPLFALQFVRSPNGRVFGSKGTGSRYGFAPRRSFRVIGKRSATNHSELAGLNDVPLSVEIGGGIGYTSQNFDAFADLRYGALGHHAFVGEVGANVILRPSDRLTITAGPRLAVGSNRFNDTYFGVTAAESLASSGALTAYNPSSGVVSAGLEVGANYAVDDLWTLNGRVRYDRFQGSVKASPIINQGAEDQLRVTIGLSRLFTLSF